MAKRRSGCPGRVALALLCLRVWLQENEASRVSADANVLPPYAAGHGPAHSHRHVRDLQRAFLSHDRTFEAWPPSRRSADPVAESTVFISDLPDGPAGSRLVFGHMMVVGDPLSTLSVLEPGGTGGCERSRRATVQQTAEAAGCLYAQNAGFFDTKSDGCLGNVVSDGRAVQDSGGVQNAQFGIRRDGSLVFGYLSQEEVLDRSNPFVQLVSGVVWLLRNGDVYINQSLEAESSEQLDQNVFRDFVDLRSARSAVGHDANGNVVLFQVDGQTNIRGMNLWEVAEFLKNHGVVNAINLDGGGSASVVINGTLAGYPPDSCVSDSRWRCARAVSTALCVRGRRCQPANCSGHGDCVGGQCRCHRGWQGAACDSPVCRPATCGLHGYCTANGCVCAAGWRGETCSQECSPGYYGDRCGYTCLCFNGAPCDHVTGRCVCPAGFHGLFCEQVCPPGLYGPSCVETCQCEDECPCDPQTGSCAANSHSVLHRAGKCLAKRMFTAWRRQEESLGHAPYLTERTWLIVTVTLASVLLIRLMCSSWKWLRFGFSFTRITRVDVIGKAVTSPIP